MIDPWADVRERLEWYRRDGIKRITEMEASALLKDADALLEYYRAHREVEKGAVDFALQNEQVARMRKAIGALPEHLRERVE